MHNHEEALKVFRKGTVIPATPLALEADKTLDEQSQRLLMRYYLDCGVGGIATAVHSTQFAIRNCGLFVPVITLVSQEVDRYEIRTGRTIVKICGACGPTEQAVSEAKIARSLGYDAILLSPGGLNDKSEEYLIERAQAVSAVLPIIGFYLQTAVGGRVFSFDYWAKMAEIKGLIGIKCASFNRYTTLDVMRAVVQSSRADEIAMYTGNDDNIVSDLVSTYVFPEGSKHFEGGLLGHWCIWTRSAVELFDKVHEARKTGDYSELLAMGPQITDMNAAAFDSIHGFAGCIPGINEVLRRQGLMKSARCLDDSEVLSPGQSQDLDRVIESYPQLTDNAFVADNIDKWKNQA